MRLGTGTWHFRNFTVETALRKIRTTGYSVAEVWMEHLLRTGEDAAAIKQIANDLGLGLTVHAATYDLNCTSSNSGARKEALRQAIESIVTCAQIGGETVVMHPGRLSKLNERAEDHLDRLHDLLLDLERVAVAENVILALEIMENRPKEILVHPETVINFMKNGWKNLRLTFDVAHAYTVMDPVDFLEQIDPSWIAHVHISDGDANNIHLPLGKGNIHLQKALDKIASFYDGTIVVEGYRPEDAEGTVADNYQYLNSSGWI